MSDLDTQFTKEHFALNSISAFRQEQVLAAIERLKIYLGKPMEEATANDLRGWLVLLLEEGRQPSTVAWYLRMVKPFYNWCWQHEIIDAERIMRIREVRPPRGHDSKGPRPYSRRELAELWAQLDARFPYRKETSLKRWRNGTSHFRNVRRHAKRLQLDAMIDLALACGLRRSEIYNLSIDDVHWDNYYIHVQGKRVDQNPKERDVPYPDSTRAAIKAWVHMRSHMDPEAGVGLWLSLKDPNPFERLSERRMRELLHSFGGDWTWHRLRHTCATERLRAGMDIVELRDFLGHASISQTLQYAKLMRTDIHEASERTDAAFQRAIRPAA